MRALAALAALAALLLAGPAAADSAYVIMGDGGAIARVITTAASCPAVRVDGHDMAMTVRFAAGSVPQRPTSSTPERSKPSAFPVTVCDLTLPTGAARAMVGGVRLPLPRADIRRIVVIGDTGCRLKAADNAFQPCNDPAKFPFARIAARAARSHPDLVVHVGDYEYRENPCPDGNAGCAGSPWGYGWDAWAADFFDPAAPLLAAAPLAPARGNHESCNRAGQGWWRFLDGRPRVAGRDCDDPANDHAGDWSAPFAVPLGHGAQIVLLDLSAAGGKALAAGDWRIAAFETMWQQLATLAAGARFTFGVDHYPILGFAASDPAGGVTPGNRAIQSVFSAHGPRQLPPGVEVLLSGHTHLWEAVGFAGDVPSQFITGFSGTLEDVVPLPAVLPAGSEAAPGAVASDFASWVDGFGYMVLDRKGPTAWRATVRGVDDRAVNRCTIRGHAVHCAIARVGG